MRTSILVATILGCSALAGCSTNTSSEATSAESELQSETVIFESDLRDDPDPSKADPSCDSYTDLRVVKTSSGTLKARLENKLSGECEISIIPDAREYTLTQSKDCGSTIYGGANGKDFITIQDNRTRECEDLRPSTIEVTEAYNGGNGWNSYGEVKSTKRTTPSPKVLLSAKLYDEPNPKVAPDCDLFTKITVTEQDGKATATIVNSLAGSCEIAVQPNERSFDVEASEDCGSRIYTAKAGANVFRAQNNASRVCEDIRPAMVEANEGTKRYYSNP